MATTRKTTPQKKAKPTTISTQLPDALRKSLEDEGYDIGGFQAGVQAATPPAKQPKTKIIYKDYPTVDLTNSPHPALRKPELISDFKLPTTWLGWKYLFRLDADVKSKTNGQIIPGYAYDLWQQGYPIYCWIAGGVGTGKTQAVEQFAGLIGKPLVYIAATKDSQPRMLLGTQGIRPDPKGKGGVENYWIEGVLFLAARYNAVLHIDEFTNFSPPTQARLCEFAHRQNAILHNPLTNEVVCAWERPVIILSGNNDLAGNHQLQQAVTDRFEPILATYLTPQDEIQLIVDRTGIDASYAKRAVDVATEMRRMAEGTTSNLTGSETTGIPEMVCSPRSIISWARMVVAGADENEAWLQCVIGRVGGFAPASRPARVEAATAANLKGSFSIPEPIL